MWITHIKFSIKRINKTIHKICTHDFQIIFDEEDKIILAFKLSIRALQKKCIGTYIAILLYFISQSAVSLTHALDKLFSFGI